MKKKFFKILIPFLFFSFFNINLLSANIISEIQINGNDRISGGSDISYDYQTAGGDDVIYGGDGDDTISAAGNSTLYGEGGDGAGNCSPGNGKAGGSGIVIIRYKYQ